MNDKDLKPETVAEPDDETTRSDDIAPADRRQSLRRSGLDRRDPNGRHIRVPDRRKNGDRRITGRRKEDPK
jgi:hypothetical protein